MLLEFRASNYKSFGEELVFSMIPAPKQKGLDYSVLKARAGGKGYKALCSSVIYGPNASGKTNIIGAMEVFKAIVLRGHIRDVEEAKEANAAVHTLGLIPNSRDPEHRPVSFSLKFIEQDLLIEYAFSIDLGTFLAYDHKRRILSEELKIDERPIFSRKESRKIDRINAFGDYFPKEYTKNAEGALKLASSNLNDQELFLVNGFKNVFSQKLAAMIVSWLVNKLMIFYRADAVHAAPAINDIEENNFMFIELLNNAAAHFGAKSEKIGYTRDSNDNQTKLCTAVAMNGRKALVIPADTYESYGTIRFMNIFPLIRVALLEGGTLVMDEFDASIHPMAIMNIINIFHNDEINVNGAQLIFNTHNPIFLNANLFRRDEIKFVERDEESGISEVYSLADFGTAGRSGVRKNEDYMKNYFVDRYGAIRDVDFAPFLENFSQSEGERR